MLPSLKLLVNLTLVFAVFSACRSLSNKTADSNLSENAQAESIDREWQLLIAENSGNLQAGCEPLRIPPKGKRQGIVVLYHGFTACPQQFEAIGARLAAQGYEVFAPLLTGHGNKPRNLVPRVDSNELLPNIPIGYEHSLERMARIVAASSGRKIVGGLSLGGALAMLAIVKAPQLYDAGIILVPNFKYGDQAIALITSPVDLPFDIMIGDKTWDEMELSWGSECWHAEAQRGRAGYCKFLVKHVATVAKFGGWVRGKLETLLKSEQPIKTHIQFIGSTNDPAVSNPTMLEVAGSLKAKTRVDICFYRNAGHSLLSPYDKPFNKPWLASLLGNIENFVVHKKVLAVEANPIQDMAVCAQNN